MVPSSRFVRPASSGQRLLGVTMLGVSFLYLVRFVPRGWIPHDEGMIGQTAEWVLQGGVPHIDYEEPYTGGLSFAYAFLFRVSGIELLHVRWMLFGAACLA